MNPYLALGLAVTLACMSFAQAQTAKPGAKKPAPKAAAQANIPDEVWERGERWVRALGGRVPVACLVDVVRTGPNKDPSVLRDPKMQDAATAKATALAGMISQLAEARAASAQLSAEEERNDRDLLSNKIITQAEYDVRQSGRDARARRHQALMDEFTAKLPNCQLELAWAS